MDSSLLLQDFTFPVSWVRLCSHGFFLGIRSGSVDRASKIGVEEWIVDRLKAMQLATFGNFAFAVAYSPQSANDTMFKEFVADLLQAEPDASQLATLRRLFFECHTRALVDVRSRVESNADPSATQRHLPTAERVARQSAQEAKLGGLILTPDTIPSHHLVDMFVEMCETGILVYVKPELCCSRAQETQTMKRDSAISTDASGLLKISPKAQGPQVQGFNRTEATSCAPAPQPGYGFGGNCRVYGS